jgi:hypothetical protein
VVPDLVISGIEILVLVGGDEMILGLAPVMAVHPNLPFRRNDPPR